ncbi:MAG: porin family protein [Bacteroidales bacterium]
MVKQLILLPFLLVILLLFSYDVQSQRILGAVSLGMNITQVDGDDLYGFHKVGLNVGPMVAVPFGKKKNWSVSMELLYSQKGSHHNGGSDSTTSYSYTLSQDYAEIPILVHVSDKKLISGGLGFSYGQLINYKETHNAFFDTLYNYQTPLSNNDISIIGDLQIRIWSKLWANIRYQYSVKSNRTVIVDNPKIYPRKPETRKQFNNVISVRVIWVFNQEKIAKIPRQQSTGDY